MELLSTEYVIENTWLIKLGEKKDSTATTVTATSTLSPRKTLPKSVRDIQDASRITQLHNNNTLFNNGQ
ncbi:8300_t:CDS:1, partial [Paraglomus occultum]